MARRHNSNAGCGCVLLGMLLFCVLPPVGAVVALVTCAPGLVAYLLVSDPAVLGQNPAWLAVAAAAPLLLWLLCWSVVARRVQPTPLVHVRRATVLLGLCTAAVVTVLGTHPPTAAGDFTLAAGFVPLGIVGLGLIVIRFRDRRLPLRQRAWQAPTSRYVPPDPEPGEIWFAMVAFDRTEGEKDRPVLVLRTHERDCEVLQITSQDKSQRHDHVLYRHPTGTPGEIYGWMELQVRWVPRCEFRRLTDDVPPPHIWAFARRRFGDSAA